MARSRGSITEKKTGKRLNPVTYILKETWRNKSRTSLSIAGLAALSFLFVIFSSMQAGLEEYASGDTGIPTQEDNDLILVKEVMDNWIYLITILCWTLMVLVVTNTSGINEKKRKGELATLRALGLSSFQVSSLIIGGMALIIYGGIAAGTILGIVCIPILDGVSLDLMGGGLAFPFSFDPNTILVTLLIGTVSGVVGMIPPVIIINRSRPAEVLRDA